MFHVEQWRELRGRDRVIYSRNDEAGSPEDSGEQDGAAPALKDQAADVWASPPGESPNLQPALASRPVRADNNGQSGYRDPRFRIPQSRGQARQDRRICQMQGLQGNQSVEGFISGFRAAMVDFYPTAPPGPKSGFVHPGRCPAGPGTRPAFPWAPPGRSVWAGPRPRPGRARRNPGSPPPEPRSKYHNGASRPLQVLRPPAGRPTPHGIGRSDLRGSIGGILTGDQIDLLVPAQDLRPVFLAAT